MVSSEDIKKNVGLYAANLVKQGMIIGLGTGSTVYWLLQALIGRVKQGLQIAVVPTSIQTEQLARQWGLSVCDLNETGDLALTIDGADEIDPDGQMIKGGGGALLQEKIVAAASLELIIIADSTKLVPRLGEFPLPVEVIPFGYKKVWQQIILQSLCKRISLRRKDGKPFMTDHQHYILDCEFECIADAKALHGSLRSIPGVVETGLFLNMASQAIVGFPDGRIETIKYK